MSRHQYLPALIIAAVFGVAAHAAAQAPAAGPHTIVIQLIQQPGAKPYAFDPANITAERGDTLRFVNAVDMMHNVHFIKTPKGAHLGSAEMGPYLTTKGQVYSVVVDSRFAAGAYEIVCDPHATIGMHAFLNVADGKAKVASAK